MQGVAVQGFYEMGYPRRIGIALAASLALHLAVLHQAAKMQQSHGNGLGLPAAQAGNQLFASLSATITNGHDAAPALTGEAAHQVQASGVSSSGLAPENSDAQPNGSASSDGAALDQRAKELPNIDGIRGLEDAYFSPSDVQVPTHPLTPVNLEGFTKPVSSYTGQVVTLRIFTDEFGDVQAVEPLQQTHADADVVSQLVEAVKQTSFAPALRENSPVASYVVVELSMESMVAGLHLGK